MDEAFVYALVFLAGCGFGLTISAWRAGKDRAYTRVIFGMLVRRSNMHGFNFTPFERAILSTVHRHIENNS